MAATQSKEASTTASNKKQQESLEHVEPIAPKYRQNFFTIFDDEEEDDQFIPELIATGKDPYNHNIEVELGRDEERPKGSTITGRRGNPGIKPVYPLPFIKVDLNNNHKNWDTIFGDLKETKDQAEDQRWLKADQPVHNDPGFMPPVTFASSQAGGSSNTPSTVFGADIHDIPTKYHVPEVSIHELPVVGTFVHGMILPGFPYRVRLNGSDEYLFEGDALLLHSIGQGYGKRLTFESDDLLNNKNFFWSDNNPPCGYALSIRLPIAGDYVVKNQDNNIIGSVSVEAVDGQQTIQSVQCLQDAIQMEVQVKMLCHFASLPNMDISEGILGGVAIAKRKGRNVEVDQIVNVDIKGIGNYCELIKK